MDADTAGAEISGRVQLSKTWGIDSAFSSFHVSPSLHAGVDASTENFDGRAPASQWRAHTAFPVGMRGQADVHLFHVGSIRLINVPAYTRLDGRIEWRLTDRLSAIGSGQNLLQRSHPEFYGRDTNIQATLVPRSAAAHLAFRF
jgi:iron complex outermembrane receptor protein